MEDSEDGRGTTQHAFLLVASTTTSSSPAGLYWNYVQTIINKDGTVKIRKKVLEGGYTFDDVAWGDWNTFTTTANLLSQIKKIDGTGSGLDADLLDGIQGEGYSKYTKVNQSSSSSKEINNLVTNGLHFVEIASTKVTGSPTGAAGKFSVVVVMNGTTYVTQTATDLSDGKVYIRCRNGSTTWGSWSELTPLIPVLTADPSSPSNGQLWIRSDL